MASALHKEGRAETKSFVSWPSELTTKTTTIERKGVDEYFTGQELKVRTTYNNLQEKFEAWKPEAEPDMAADCVVSELYAELFAVQEATQQFEQLPEN